MGRHVKPIKIEGYALCGEVGLRLGSQDSWRRWRTNPLGKRHGDTRQELSDAPILHAPHSYPRPGDSSHGIKSGEKKKTKKPKNQACAWNGSLPRHLNHQPRNRSSRNRVHGPAGSGPASLPRERPVRRGPVPWVPGVLPEVTRAQRVPHFTAKPPYELNTHHWAPGPHKRSCAKLLQGR